VDSYLIAKQIGYAEVLKALSELAPQLGLPEGLDGWEMLSNRMKDGEPQTEDQEGGLEKVRQFVQVVISAAKEKSADAEKYFENVSKMASDPNAPPEFQELGKVLRDYMAGVKNPDLSKLPEELAQVVREAIG
jgi:hypothetical protein